MKKNIIKNALIILMMLGGFSAWCQKECFDYFDPRITMAKTRIAQTKAPQGSKMLQDLHMKLQEIERQKDSCLAAKEGNAKPPTRDTVKPNNATPTQAPVAVPETKEIPATKIDTPAAKDDKLPPQPAPIRTGKPDPRRNLKPQPGGPAQKSVIKDIPVPAPKSEKGVDYSSRIDTIDRNVNSFKVRIEDREFYFIVVDLEKSDIQLHLHHTRDKYAGHNFSTIEALLSSQEVNIAKTEMITNGGMYMQNGQPQGLYIENGQELAHIDTADPKNGDNFHLMPNGVFFIKKGEAHILTTESFRKTELGDTMITFATQSGPMLVIDGKRHPAFTEGSKNEKLRSGVCVVDKKTVVFAICDQINFWDFANFFKDYIKGRNALFLDGSVSRMYLKKGLKGNIRKDMDGTFGPMISVTAK